MLFSNKDFNFAHFSNFNFAHFKIEESFGLIWVKLQNGRVHFENFHFEYLKRCSFQVWAVFLIILCIKEVFGKFGKNYRMIH